MKTTTLAFILIAALGACGKNKSAATGPSNKTDTKAGSTGGATYGGNTAPATPPPPTTATPNPCGAGM